MKIEGFQATSALNADKRNEIKAAADTFAKILSDSITETNRLQLEADKMDTLFAAGMIDNIADVTIASTKADIAISYAVEIISKVLNAYNEIMRLQL